MSAVTSSTIIADWREEYQIPPFVKNTTAISIYDSSNAYIQSIQKADYESDLIALGLLKKHMWYSYYHRENEFYEDHKNDIVSWQMSSFGGVA